MTDIKKVLTEKFIELGSKVPLIQDNHDLHRIEDSENCNHIENIRTMFKFREWVKGNLSTYNDLTWTNIDYVYNLSGLPFSIIRFSVNRNLHYNVKRNYTYSRKNYIQVDSYSISTKTLTGLSGELLSKGEKKFKHIEELEDKTTTKEYCGSYRKGSHVENAERSYKKLDNGSYEDNFTNSVKISESFYVLHYKDVFCVISKDQKEKILIDMEAKRGEESLLELKTLDVSNIQENIKKMSDVNDTKATIRSLTESVERLTKEINNKRYY